MSATARSAPDNVLVLQGGGALGSYQAGVYEALAAADLVPDWVAGISIGAINAALIAGNPPERRVERLHEFWDLVTSGFTASFPGLSDNMRGLWNETAAAWTMAAGVPGFFKPVLPPPLPWLGGPIAWYDTTPLKATLERLVDFDRINHGDVRLSVGAVNVESGNFRYFCSHQETIRVEHIMASGALPPGFPPVEIDGEYWWDGGLVSNTPLEFVLDHERERDLLIFQVDLFPARGPLPQSIAAADERAKDIRFSSRTRLNTDRNMELRKARQAFMTLATELPEALKESEAFKFLHGISEENAVAIAQLIYKDKAYESGSKDYEFSRATMLDHWTAGLEDVETTVCNAPWLHQPLAPGITSYDLSERHHAPR